jgi:hypothetical protein
VKPWDDETDMAKLEEAVRSVKIRPASGAGLDGDFRVGFRMGIICVGSNGFTGQRVGGGLGIMHLRVEAWGTPDRDLASRCGSLPPSQEGPSTVVARRAAEVGALRGGTRH